MGKFNSIEAMSNQENIKPILFPLTDAEKQVIIHKGTEQPFSGEYLKNKEKGYYVCKQCRSALYKSESKFESSCGWPSFDDEIFAAVKHIPDADGQRTEIICANCNGHLGHVFTGEGFTDKNIRHCVNSISLTFIPQTKTEQAIFASGCFWGVQYHLKKLPGILETRAGYTGGKTKNPTYKEVCSGKTGHAEAVEVIFDPSTTNYETIAKLYFETHDPTQINRQGPDIGDQYRSEIFYTSEPQRLIAEKLITFLTKKGLKIATKITAAGPFYPAEDYHQYYYEKKGGQPYCHIYTKRF